MYGSRPILPHLLSFIWEDEPGGNMGEWCGGTYEHVDLHDACVILGADHLARTCHTWKLRFFVFVWRSYQHKLLLSGQNDLFYPLVN